MRVFGCLIQTPPQIPQVPENNRRSCDRSKREVFCPIYIWICRIYIWSSREVCAFCTYGATGRVVPFVHMKQQGGLCPIFPSTLCYPEHFLLCYPHLLSAALKRVMRCARNLLRRSNSQGQSTRQDCERKIHHTRDRRDHASLLPLMQRPNAVLQRKTELNSGLELQSVAHATSPAVCSTHAAAPSACTRCTTSDSSPPTSA
jgi:hypothetical protein